MVDLSDGAKRILLHFKERAIAQGDYELPAKLEALFERAEDCERAQNELKAYGFIELGRERHFTDPSGVRATALTRGGARYLSGIA